jgi:transcriptional regulator with XRE-family HTH domain
MAGIPRPTIALVESGSANPTLAVLSRLSAALHVTLDELITAPRSQLQVYRAASLPVRARGPGGRVRVQALLPDALPGLEIERLLLPRAAHMPGIPHRAGTREYLWCESGRIELVTQGETVALESGDLVAFQGDQPHSYRNIGEDEAVGFSVVAVAPPVSVKHG